jgi:hypothetical protein
MDSISSVSSGMTSVALQQDHGGPKRVEGDHGRDRSTESTTEIHKGDQKEKQQTRALDVEA